MKHEHRFTMVGKSIIDHTHLCVDYGMSMGRCVE